MSFMMTVHPYQTDTNCKHSRMSSRACAKLPLDVDGIDDRIDTQILKTPHIILFHLAALNNGRNSDIGTLKKERGDIFLECCTKIFKAKLIHYVNEVLFEMVKTALKDTYLEGKSPAAHQN